MIQTFTQDDVIRYAYNETSDHENTQIEELLAHDSVMLAFYLNVLDSQLALNKAELAPSKRSIHNILAYSASHYGSSLRFN